MGEAVRFTRKGRDYDVPVTEAEALARRLMEKAEDDVTTSDGGLAVAIQAAIADESTTDIELEGEEHESLWIVIGDMIGSGRTSERSALERLRDDMTPRDEGEGMPT